MLRLGWIILRFRFRCRRSGLSERVGKFLQTGHLSGFICHGDSYSNQLVIDAARDRYPELRSRTAVGNPGVNEVTEKIAAIDTTPAEQILGVKFVHWYQSIAVETIPALLQLEKNLEK